MSRLSAYSGNFSDLFDYMNRLFDDSLSMVDSISQPRYNKLISSGEWPPANVLVDKNSKELTIEVALVGCDEENVLLSFDGDYLKLVANGCTEVPDEKRDEIYIQRGLKKIGEITSKWKIDPRFYSRDNVDVNFKNGLLTIKVFPKEDVKPRKVEIFGNYKEIEQK